MGLKNNDQVLTHTSDHSRIRNWHECGRVTVYNLCWTFQVPFVVLLLQSLWIACPSLGSPQLKTPLQHHAKSNNAFWKTSTSSWDKSNQLSKEKERWMGHRDTWVQVPVQQIISEVTLSTCPPVPNCASVFLGNKAWTKSIALHLGCTWESSGNYFKILTPETYPNQLNQISEGEAWASVFKSPTWF